MIKSLTFTLSLLFIASAADAQAPADKRSLQSVFATNGSFDKLTGKAARAGTWESTSGEATALVIGLADKIAAYLDETGRIGEITETPPDQMVSPFTAAVMSGTAEIVAVYLRYPDVRARLNEPLEFHSIKGDRHLKAHAWAIAAAAPFHSVSFCGGEFSALFFGYAGLATYLEAQPGETPYRRVLAALEAAGAKPQPEEARAVWRVICGGDDRPDDGKWSDTARTLNYEAALVPGSRERVLKAPHMLDAIEAELRALQSLRSEGKVPFVVLPRIDDSGAFFTSPGSASAELKDNPMKRFILLALLAAVSPASAQPQGTTGTAEIINTLFQQRIRGLTREYPRDWASIRHRSELAVQETADQLRQHLEKGDNAKELQMPMGGPDALTPLAAAAYMGLADLIEVMLVYPEAREQLNRPLPKGQSLWALVSNAPLVAQMACLDVERLGGAPGSLQGYLGFDAARSPYRKTLSLLEQAGAVPQPEEARALWRRNCDPSRFNGQQGVQESSPGVSERIANAPDTLEAILKEVESQPYAAGVR